MLTFLPLEQIEEMDKWEGAQLNEAKEILAYELCSMVHGNEEAEKAREASRSIFVSGGSSENMPTTELSEDDFVDGKILVADMLVKAGLAPSKGEAKRIISGGGVFVGDTKAEGFGAAVMRGDFTDDGVIVRKGKKTYHKFKVK